MNSVIDKLEENSKKLKELAFSKEFITSMVKSMKRINAREITVRYHKCANYNNACIELTIKNHKLCPKE